MPRWADVKGAGTRSLPGDCDPKTSTRARDCRDHQSGSRSISTKTNTGSAASAAQATRQDRSARGKHRRQRARASRRPLRPEDHRLDRRRRRAYTRPATRRRRSYSEAKALEPSMGASASRSPRRCCSTTGARCFVNPGKPTGAHEVKDATNKTHPGNVRAAYAAQAVLPPHCSNARARTRANTARTTRRAQAFDIAAARPEGGVDSSTKQDANADLAELVRLGKVIHYSASRWKSRPSQGDQGPLAREYRGQPFLDKRRAGRDQASRGIRPHLAPRPRARGADAEGLGVDEGRLSRATFWAAIRTSSTRPLTPAG